MRRPFRLRRSDRGFALIAILTLLIAGALAFLVAIFGPEAMEAYRRHKTEAALAEAREALLGYATKYRDVVATGDVYGFLPLPDLGTSHNNNGGSGCNGTVLEGCDAAIFSGNSSTSEITVIGRFPWRLLGTAPLRDGQGECLWLAISGRHRRIHQTGTMNWDTLGQLDIVVAKGELALKSLVDDLGASRHERPVAIIFSPGPALPGQDRSNSTDDNVTECGGNYNVRNYLDPASVAVKNYFDGATYPSDGVVNNAFGDTSATVKAIAAGGSVFKDSDSKLWSDACPSGSGCTLAANDRGLAISPNTLFGSIRKSSGFRTDINSMLDRMVGCLRDQMASGGGFIPDPITNYASPGDKSAGRIPSNTCYNDAKHPKSYFTHWREMFFVARTAGACAEANTSGCLTVSTPRPFTAGSTYDDNSSCAGVLIFSGQRVSGQSRYDDASKAIPSNYLEDESTTEPTNLAHFTGTGTTFKGADIFDLVSTTQAASRDIVRCIPITASLQTAASSNSTGDLANYDPGTQTLTLGTGENVNNRTGSGNSGWGCAWTPETYSRDKGFRAYFNFRFYGVERQRTNGPGLTSGVGNSGFTFAIIDGEKNTTGVCGQAGSHLGYSGNNGVAAPIAAPKIGIEFDQSRDTGIVSNATNSGRNDPDRSYTCSGTPHSVSYFSHSAILYSGEDGTEYDDNAHGYPTIAATTRPEPQNPSDLCTATPGIGFVDYRAHEHANSDGYNDSYLYHVRIEVTPTRNTNASAAELSNTSFVTQVWIEHSDSNIIAAMQNTTRPMAQLLAQLNVARTADIADTATVYDVAGSACNTDGSCSDTGYTCGSDNVCYRQGLRKMRLGFTSSQYTQAQKVIISDFFTSWLQ